MPEPQFNDSFLKPKIATSGSPIFKIESGINVVAEPQFDDSFLKPKIATGGSLDVDIDMGKAAELHPLSQATGIPVENLYKNYDEIKKVVQSKKDEGMIRSMQASYKVADYMLRKNWLNWRWLKGEEDPNIDTEIAKLNKQIERESQFITDDGLFDKAVNTVTGLIPQRIRSTGAGLKGALTTGMLLGGATALFVPPAAPAATGMGFRAGLVAFSTLHMTRLEAGALADTLRNLKDDKGNPIDPKIVRTFAMAYGAVSGALEAVELKLLLKTIPGLDKMMQDMVQKSVTKLIKDGSVSKFLLASSGRYATFLGKETLIENLQEDASMIMEEFAKNAHELETGGVIDSITLDEILERHKETTFSSLLGFGILGAPGHAMQTLPGIIDYRSQVKEKALRDLFPEDTDTDYTQEMTNTYERFKNIFLGGRDLRIINNLNDGRRLKEELDGLVQEEQTVEELAVAMSLYRDSKNNPEAIEAALRGEQYVAPEDTVTLYRAYSPTVKFEDVFEVEKLTKFKPPEGVEGEFYTNDRNYAEYFKETYGKDASIESIEVSVAESKQYESRPGEYYIPKKKTKSSDEYVSEKGNVYKQKKGKWYDEKGKEITDKYKIRAIEKGVHYKTKKEEQKQAPKKVSVPSNIGYSTHGQWTTSKRIYELEHERGNVVDDKLLEPGAKAIWITRKPEDAVPYNRLASERDLPIQENEIESLETIDLTNAEHIKSMDDGDGGELWLLRPKINEYTSKKGNIYTKKEGKWYDKEGEEVTNKHKIRSIEKGAETLISKPVKKQRTPKKVSKPLSETQTRLIEMSKNLTQKQKTFVDKIGNVYNIIAEEALGDEIIFNTLNNFTARSWISNKKTRDIVSRLTQTTIHARERRLPTIVEGWTEGLSMKTHSIIDNLVMYREDMIKVIEQKRFIQAMLKGKNEAGNPIFSTERLQGYEKIETPRYTPKKGTVYFAPRDVARNVNNIFGVSALDKYLFFQHLTKFNALLKKIALSTSLFHNVAFFRSFYLGGKSVQWENMNVFTAHREGVEMIKNMDEMVKIGVYNGLTLSLIQDWEEELLIMGSDIDKITNKHTKSKRIRSLVSDLWRRQVNFTFGVQGAGLKVKAFAYEFQNECKKHPDENKNKIAARIASLVNDDFGGLHLERIGRDKTMQHIFRLVALAPDWTESNIRTVTGMFKRAKKGGYKAQRQLYQRFWARIVLKTAVATAVGNTLLAGGDVDEAWKRYKEAVDKDWKNIAAVDITGLWHLFGMKPQDRKYFSIAGHFLDPAKYADILLGEPKILQYKASIVARLASDWLFNENWRGKRFKNLAEIPTGVKEFAEYLDPDAYVTYAPEKRQGTFLEKNFTWPAFLIHSIIGGSPIAFQNLLACISGEQDILSGVLNTLGVRQPRTKRKQGWR